jgi:hypothetical protein
MVNGQKLMKVKIFFLTLLFITANLFAEETPVMLFLSKNDQSDSLGFNLVESLPGIVYKEIMANHVVLWDSPKMEDRIEAKTLKTIEKSSNSSFSITNSLFILEQWKIEKKSLTVKTLGFYFSAKNMQGEEVSYGFVEYKSLDSVLRTTTIPANANGSCNTTFNDVLKQKLYYYNVVQYNNKRIANLQESVNIKNEIKPLLPKKAWSREDDCKVVKYVIEEKKDSAGNAGAMSKKLLMLFEKYFNENQEIFMNMGGDLLMGDTANYKVRVSGLQVEEYWIKNDDHIDYSIYKATVLVNGKPLASMPADDLQTLNFLIGFKPVNDFIKEKEFYFRIVKINNEDIPASLAKGYLNALNNYKWNHVIEYAKYD